MKDLAFGFIVASIHFQIDILEDDLYLSKSEIKNKKMYLYDNSCIIIHYFLEISQAFLLSFCPSDAPHFSSTPNQAIWKNLFACLSANFIFV